MDIRSQKSGSLKIAGGLALMILGLIGLIFGRNAKQITLRVCIIVLSAGCLGAGFYLFVDGLDDVAIGRAGSYKLDGPPVQPIYYPGPAYFKAGLVAAFAHQPNIRRMTFHCPDGSQTFTVFNTNVGVLNVPDQDVICANGFPLVTYDLNKLPADYRELFTKPAGIRRFDKPVDK